MPPTFPKWFKMNEIKGLNGLLVLMLDQARERAGIPFQITSGLRTQDENIRVHGAQDSAHLKGLAVDILCLNNNTRFKIVKSLIDVGFKRIEIAPKHIHTDIDNTKSQEIIFLK